MRNVFVAMSALSLAVALGGCGGDGGSVPTNSYDDTVPAVTISPAELERMGRDIPQAGTYTVAISGQFTPTKVASGDQLLVRVFIVGTGAATGDTQLSYPLEGAGQPVQIDGHSTVTLTGGGPWQIWVLYQSQDAMGDLTNLRVRIEG